MLFGLDEKGDGGGPKWFRAKNAFWIISSWPSLHVYSLFDLQFRLKKLAQWVVAWSRWCGRGDQFPGLLFWFFLFLRLGNFFAALFKRLRLGNFSAVF